MRWGGGARSDGGRGRRLHGDGGLDEPDDRPLDSVNAIIRVVYPRCPPPRSCTRAVRRSMANRAPARWLTTGPNPSYGCRTSSTRGEIVDAGRALVVWEHVEEPTKNWRLARPHSSVTRHARRVDRHRRAARARLHFVSSGEAGRPAAGLSTMRRLYRRPVAGPTVDHVGGRTLASVPFRPRGRVACSSDLVSPTLEIVPLTRSRRAGVWHLARSGLSHTCKHIAAGEERIRVARDLHDGVLQSLAGIRLKSVGRRDGRYRRRHSRSTVRDGARSRRTANSACSSPTWSTRDAGRHAARSATAEPG